ncbi:MAG: hypothetical protein H6636_09290 [Anaerolineales bacterium]|nr:hypothetical protein [Anaerolineales bacterium]
MLRVKHLLLFLALTLLTACTPIAQTEQPGTNLKIPLSTENPVGQTFVASYDGLNGFEITIRANTSCAISYLLTPDKAHRLSIDEITLEPSSVPVTLRLPFEARIASAQEDYRISLETDCSTPITLRAAPGATYLNGSAYQDGALPDAQLAFGLTYDPFWVAWGLIKLVGTWAGMVILFGVVYALPGWALLSALWPGWINRTLIEKLLLAAGAGLAIYPLLLEWTDVVGLHLGAFYAWGPPVLSAGYLVWANRKTIRNTHYGIRWSLQNLDPEPLLFLLLAALVFATRFWAIRGLDAPMFGDAFQHTMMTQLLIDHGGLFESWQPYAELSTFTYHFGFHTHAAVLHWLTGMSATQAVLWAGQLLNALAVLVLYPLGNKLGGRWAGVGAVLVAGLLSSMPMFYVNWGRYTQLTGQALLVVIAFLLWDWFDRRKNSWRGQMLIGVLMGGLALTHYRVIVFAVLLLPVGWMVWGRRENWRDLFWLSLGAGIIGGVLFLPQFINVFGGKILAIFVKQVSTPATALADSTVRYNAIGALTAYLPGWIWAGGLAVAGWGLWRRNRWVLALIGWFALLVLAANPAWVGLPGSGSLSSFAVFIAAYIPAGVLLGAGLGWLAEHFRAGWVRFLWTVGVWGVVGGMALLGARMRIAEVAPAQFALVTRPDVKAAEWIQANTPEDAKFLVNGFLTDGDISVVGSDAGWWLPLLAHRAVTVPPLTYMMEQNFDPDFRAQLRDFAMTLRAEGVTSPDVLAQLAAEGVGYVYIGQQQGHVNWLGPVLNPLELVENEHFRVVYHQDRVWIFEVRP